jgi:transcriptional regulator with XRE-family HTH domain
MSDITLSRQIALLFEFGVNKAGQSISLRDIEAGTGIRYQTLSNLLDGTANNPRLATLRELCGMFGISLDYFANDTEAACIQYLKQHRMKHASPLVLTIAQAAHNLSPTGLHNVLTVLAWMEAATNVKAQRHSFHAK